MENLHKFQGTKLSVVMSVYNEIYTVGQVIENVVKVPI